MPITPEHVGRRYPATAGYEVSRAKIAEFADALGDDNPAYRGENPIAPPTFAAVIAAQAWDALFDDPDLDLALMRTMHAEQGFRYVRPFRPGDLVTATLTIDKVRQRGNLDWVGVCVALSVDGAEVCTATSTLLHTREDANE